MSEDLLKEALADQPRLMAGYITTPIVIRNEHWVIVKNPITGAYTRLHGELWNVVLELDGSRTVRQWLHAHTPVFGDRQLLAAILTLQRAGIVNSSTNNAEIGSRKKALLSRHNPLMIRVPVFNPSRLLDGVCSASRVFSMHTLMFVLLATVILALYSVTMNWTAVVVQWSSVSGSALVWHFLLLYPLTKCFHELAHGWALRRLGGEVPEAGISLIVLFPMPYVDATDAWSLQRGQRMLVTAAGMLMDLLVASIGVVLWLSLSGGVLADMAFSVALMGFVSVILFNANPLLKFDGYYLLEDMLDSPGLARRSLAYYRYLSKRYILFMERCDVPVIASGEKPWLLLYGLFSTLYRFFIAAVISLYLVNTFHEIGFILSLFAIMPLCVTPVYRFIKFLCSSSELGGQRLRTVSVVSVIAMFVIGILFNVPMPSSTRTQGVVWVAQQAEVFAAQDGQLESILVANGESVEKGQPLMILGSDELYFEHKNKQLEVRLAKLDVSRFRYSDPGQARFASIALRQAESELEAALLQFDKLTIRSPSAGRIAFNEARASNGSFVSQGELIAYVVNENERVVRAVVDQNALGKLNNGVQGVSVRLAHDIGLSRSAKISRQVPSGNHSLPSAALADTGFGGFEVTPSADDDTLQTRDKVFHLELILAKVADNELPVPMGSRAYVTLEHANEPLAQRWIRLSRQLLLKHLSA